VPVASWITFTPNFFSNGRITTRSTSSWYSPPCVLTISVSCERAVMT
jgi:hypothetical protein